MLKVCHKYENLPEEYLTLILKYEGGYVNDPLDKGGETNRGITIGALNEAKKQGIVPPDITIKDLTHDLESVRKIYDINYYKKSKANLMSHPLAFAHFDASVNHGIGWSSKFLQRTLNKFGANLVDDGIIGPKTLAALNDIMLNVYIYKIIDEYCNIRKSFYDSIIANNPSQKKFYNGWMNRLASVREYCGVA